MKPKAEITPGSAVTEIFPYYPDSKQLLLYDGSFLYLYDFPTDTLKAKYTTGSFIIIAVLNVPLTDIILVAGTSPSTIEKFIADNLPKVALKSTAPNDVYKMVSKEKD